MFIDVIILHSVTKLRSSRTISAVYHLLKGKKSIQTIQDAKLFGLEYLFAIDKTINKHSFFQYVNQLVAKGLLYKNLYSNNVYDVTASGKQWLNAHKKTFPLHYFNGMKYEPIAETFLNRLLLVIQTFANRKMNDFAFIPIIDDVSITNWVKSFYRKTASTHGTLLNLLYKDLVYILEQMEDKEAQLFVDRFTGYKKYGMSTFQLAEKYQINVDDVDLIIKAITHYMLNCIEKNSTDFYVLSSFIDFQSRSLPISRSARSTFELLIDGNSLERIANKRRLKINTIYDHLVEISLVDEQFPFQKFVNDEEQKEIMKAVQKTNSFKLKEIKEAVSEQISYFQIRLILAKINKQVIDNES